jgi:hypothetical protein
MLLELSAKFEQVDLSSYMTNLLFQRTSDDARAPPIL